MNEEGWDAITGLERQQRADRKAAPSADNPQSTIYNPQSREETQP